VNGPPPVVASTCDISVWPLNPLACGQSFNVTYSGNANRSGTYPVRLYLNKDDYRELPLPNPGTEITFYDASQLRDLFFYQVDTCNTTDGAACTRTVTVNNVSASGGYHLFCDVTTNAPGQCSGNGACIYEGGWLNCGSLYQSCSSTDRRTFSTTSVPPTPSNFAGACNPGGTAVNLTWSDVAGETGYRITRNPAFGPPIPTLGVDRPANTTSYTDNSIASEVPPVAHQYYLQSFNACGVAPIPAVISGGVGACIVYEPWFQAEGGDVISAAGNVEATVPTTAPTPYLVANPAWDAGASSYPTVFGIPGASGNLSSSNVSLAGLLVNFSTGAPASNWSSLSTKPDNSYANISARVISRYSAQVVTDTDISELDMALIVSSALSSNHKVVPALSGYGVPSGNDLEVAVVQLAPNPPGPVTIQGMQFLGTQTNRGAIIFAEGTVNISGNITVDDSNFLAIISGGDINVSAAAGSGPTPTASPYQYPVGLGTYEPHLKGVFYAQGDFNTGIDSDQLKIEGIVVGLNLVNLQRTSTGPHPAEYFKYNPKYAGILREIGLRRKVHYERVAP